MDHPVFGTTDLYFLAKRNAYYVNWHCPKRLEGQVLNSRGKPLKRKEKSTGTPDLKLAKQRHPRIQAELFAELEQLRSKDPKKEIKQGLSAVHKQYTETISTNDEHNIFVLREAAKETDWLGPVADEQLRMLSERLLKEKGLSLDNIDLVIPSLNKVIEDVIENERRKQELGVFAEPTAFAESIAVVNQSTLTLSQIFSEHKRDKLTARAADNTADAIRHWIYVVGNDELEQVDKVNMNKYLMDMESGNTFTGKASGVDTCNARAIMITDLLSIHNQLSDNVIPVPEYKRLKKTKQQLKTDARKNANKAISDENVIRILDVLWKKGQTDNDQMQNFKGILLLACTPLRCEQIAMLRWGHIHNHKGMWVFDFLREDGNAKEIASLTQVLPLHQTLVDLLLPMRGEAQDDDFILSHQNCWALRPRGGQGFNDLLQKRDKTTKFGVPQSEPCNAHSFRHRFGDRAHAATESDMLVKKVLGHTTGNDVTRRYSRATLERVNEIVQQCGVDYQPPTINKDK